jgi:hypothetical protein
MNDSDIQLAVPHVFDGSAIRAWRTFAGRVEQFTAVIRSVSTGDYQDARYFVNRVVPGPGSTARAILSTQAESIPGLDDELTATNLAELTGGTHLLPAGTIVQVFAFEARTRPAVKVYVFDLAPVLAVVVKITSNAGSGEYNGRILAGASNATPGAALTMPAGMLLPGADDALVLNAEEDGETGHRLAAGAYSVGVVRGQTSESPPRRIVVIRGAAGRIDSPTTIGSSSDSSESADSATWSRATDGTPVDVWVISRVVYNPTGDQTLYSFARMLSFDARGTLVGISAETQITVDVTEACP